MTTMIVEVYQAFRSAGVSDEVAQSAAEALSAENLASKEDIRLLRSDVKDLMVGLEKQLLIIKWMLGLIIAVNVLPYLKQFI